MMPNASANSRVAIIAGGTGGIGRAVGLTLARRGWAIGACYRENEAKAAALRSELEGLGTPFRLIRADVSNPDAAREFIRIIGKEYGRIDALICCVGAYHRVPLMEESIEGWHTMFDHNLHTVFYLSRAVAPLMMERRWGRIVNFGMVNAGQLTGQPFITAHYIAKIGVLVLTRSLAKMLAPHGITANSVSPGFIETGSVSQEEMEQSFKSIPAGYVGSPDDVVGAVCFLLSDEARYVNGADIQVSGGWGI